MEYKIIEFDENQGTLTVAYNKLAKATLQIPIVNGRYIIGDALENFILSNAPIEEIKRLEAVTTVSNLSELRKCIFSKRKTPKLFVFLPHVPTTSEADLVEADKEYIKGLIKEIIQEGNFVDFKK